MLITQVIHRFNVVGGFIMVLRYVALLNQTSLDRYSTLFTCVLLKVRVDDDSDINDVEEFVSNQTKSCHFTLISESSFLNHELKKLGYFSSDSLYFQLMFDDLFSSIDFNLLGVRTFVRVDSEFYHDYSYPIDVFKGGDEN